MLFVSKVGDGKKSVVMSGFGPKMMESLMTEANMASSACGMGTTLESKSIACGQRGKRIASSTSYDIIALIASLPLFRESIVYKRTCFPIRASQDLIFKVQNEAYIITCD